MRESLAHQDVPIHRVLQLHGAKPGTPGSLRGGHALDQVGFYMAAPDRVDGYGLGRMLIGGETRPTEVGSWVLTPRAITSGGCQRDLQWTVWEHESDICGRVRYNPDLFEPTTIVRLVERYAALVRGLAD